jgi:Ca2+-binding RTX toxin-like protein
MDFDFSNVNFLPDENGKGFDILVAQPYIISIMRAAYTYSGTAKKMFDDWGKTINVHFSEGQFGAKAGTGNLYIDFARLNDLTYINDKGKAVPASDLGSLIHELVHALTGRTDNISPTDFQGETVRFTNTIWAEMQQGYPFEIPRFANLDKQISYTASAYSSLQKSGYDYTNDTSIDAAYNVEFGRAAELPNGMTMNAFFNRGTGLTDNDFSSIALGNSKDLLIGGSANNKLYSGAGNDFLFGSGGNDILDGGADKDTAVYFGNKSDYIIAQNKVDGSWTIRSKSTGTESAGTDKLTNIEYAQFDGGLFNLGKETVELKKSGLTFQKDFALVIDTTGSMRSSIDSIKAKVSSLIDALFADGIDARFGIVGFKDTTNGEPSQVILPFTDQDSLADRKSAAMAAINSITVGGGGDDPETDFDGLRLALNGSMGEWRYGAGTRQIVLFTDAPVKDGALAAEVTALANNIGGSIDTDPTTADVKIATIFTGSPEDNSPELATIASANGGDALTASDNDDLLVKLIDIFNPPKTIEGTATDDRLICGNEKDLIYGFAGNDIINAGDGIDTIYGGDGDDTLYGDADVDTIYGDAGNDIISGGDGNDTISGGVGNDIINGGDGNDTLYGDAGNDTLYGDAGNDTISGGDGNDAISGGVGNDIINSGDGIDTLDGGDGNDIINGGAGNDTLSGDTGDDTLHGDVGNDTLSGDAGDDNLYGEDGNDIINSGNGNDTLYGDAGDDTLSGGDGIDTLYGDAGNDTLYGGDGDDTLYICFRYS